MRRLAWPALALAVGAPLAVAAASPLNAYRDAPYVAASMAGVLALGLLLVQPALASGRLPGLRRWRGAHAWTGAALAGLVAVHVAGLWVTSPPDVVDALLLRSPTPFSIWGVLALWAVAALALTAALRRRVRPRPWRRLHAGFAVAAAGGTILHALLIQGAMGTASKLALCVFAGLAVATMAWRSITPP